MPLFSSIVDENRAHLEQPAGGMLFVLPGQRSALVDLGGEPGRSGTAHFSGTDMGDCVEVALWLREFLAQQHLDCFPKSSGSKGLQVYVPLNTAVTFDDTRRFARRAAEMLTAKHPDQVLYRMEKRLRKGKVFIDWSQNDDHKTTVCVYSLRAKARPSVSTPLKWEEVEGAFKAKAPIRLSFESHEVLKRVEKWGDLFAPVLKLKQKLPRLQG
jgi:bifunctional non-homologous end joining protein LigD